MTATEFVDEGVSGAKDRRPALDQLLAAARRHEIDVVIITKLDRLFRSVRHMVATVADFEAFGVDLVVLDQAIDTSTPSGRLLFHVLAAIADDAERDLIRDRVKGGCAGPRSTVPGAAVRSADRPVRLAPGTSASGVQRGRAGARSRER